MTFLLAIALFSAGTFVGVLACGLGRAAKRGDMAQEATWRPMQR